ncbi:uncharacterized protein LOC107781897 [Nicotiana tabacum]|uniref:Uncharacterized protein LOC107781897 n=3 Tax=Nicotiana TaxID=4085 RepID=A0AC58UAM6_TOBAC|nr:PREDICTED: uncharacterized protein LOC104241132 [Nicotiana sylvestris]XP_009794350.1 PREDICTED: uncharacterized protein LOC104241132 [Nicotiana sylvestris]XP_016458204.1 PREDICTED: uncharacterized protein LOC107781897 [Nicotiana tabacum]
MGTKIQCKTYLPGFCSMSDLNSNGTNIPWLVNHENKSRKRNQCTDSFLSPQPIDGYFECDKEKVRQTILKHEIVFRHQLQELHRLYRRQRDLMNEHQRKEMLNHPMKTFQSIPSSSHFPSLDSIAGQLSATDTAKNQSSFDFMENDSRSSHFSSQLTKSSKECESHQPSSSLFQRKMFDSRFVVDRSVNNEWVLPCIQGNPVEGTNKMPRSRDAKTPIASALEFHSDADLNRASSLKGTDELADLNKPLPLEEASPLVPDININSITCLDDDIYDGGKFSPKSLKERIGGIFLNHPPHKNGEEQLTSKLNAEKKQRDNESSGRLETAEILPKAFQSPQGHQLFRHSLFKETKTEHQRKKTIFGVEIHEENQMQSASCSNVQNATHKSPPLSQSYTKLLRNVASCQNNMHMRIDRETSCVSRTEASGKAPVSGDCQRKQENSRETLPWLVVKSQKGVEHTKGRENCYHLNLDSLQNNSQLFFRQEDTAVNSSQIIDQRQGSISSRSIFEVSDSTKIRTIFGVPIFSAPTDSHAESGLSNTAFPNVDNVTATKISGDEIVSRSQVEAKDFLQEKGLNGCISSLRHQIDLNLSLDEEEAPSAPSLPRAVVRIATTEIDLEAPAILEYEAECGESKHTLEESNKSNEAAMRLAAESIISISMSGANGEMNDALQTETSDSLKWFAELVSSHCCVQQESIATEICSGTASEFDEESIPIGFDYFEFMTLKLEDMKEEEYSYKMPTLESQNNEETVAITLPKRPRRGQGKRGRQRKDFQRDVLPGLISLSRYEVNKDILKFEELFKASGSSWQSTMSHRKTGKSGRGRKRLANADPSPTIPADCPPPVNQPCSGELGLEEKSLTGWGKRTRRLPRQRYLNGNLALLMKQC